MTAVSALTDPQILTITLYGETRGEPIEGQVAVGCVIRNRVQTGKWGSSYATVCLAPWQFSCWRPEGGRDNYELVMETAQMMTKGEMPEDALLTQCAWVAEGIIGDRIRDNVRAATHYYAPDAMTPKGSVPKWAANKIPVAKKAGHLFFAGVQ
jgi:N-acetylmuramoyl-L-alanine amidase